MLPTVSTPWACRFKVWERIRPAASTISEAGSRGRRRSSSNSEATAATPTVIVVHDQSPAWLSSFARRWKKSPSPLETPRIFPVCRTMIVNAMPKRKPTRAGSARKLVRNPSRAAPAATSTAPTVTASAADNPTTAPGSLLTPLTVDADSTAAADVAPTIRKREPPSSA
ncbi:hypothetical protein RB196_31660 [Streptomyces sp. PmtA]